MRKVNEFPGPLTADVTDQFKVHGTTVALRKFLNDRIKIAEQMKESKESQLLWSILLKIICFDDICKATLSNQRFATEVIAVLKKYISVMNAERKAIEDQTRVLTRTEEKC